MFVCSRGDISSEPLCHLHDNCASINLVWPVDAIKTAWREQKLNTKSSLLCEATICAICQKAPGAFLCIYGGHMICKNCVGKNEIDCGPCRDKKNRSWPLWINPFVHMYTCGAVLDYKTDTAVEFQTKNGMLTLKNGTITGPLNRILHIRSWQYPNDRYPACFTSELKQLSHPAWRLDIVVGAEMSLSLQRCQCMWKSSLPTISLKKVMTVFEQLPKFWTLHSHPLRLFMFAENGDTKSLLCLGCKTIFPTLDSFVASPCWLAGIIPWLDETS